MTTNTRLGGPPGVALSAPSLGPARDFPAADERKGSASTPGGKPDTPRDFPADPTKTARLLNRSSKGEVSFSTPGGVLSAALPSHARDLSPLEEPLIPGRDFGGSSEPVDLLGDAETIRQMARKYGALGIWSISRALDYAADLTKAMQESIAGQHAARQGAIE